MAGIYLHIPFCKTRCIYCDFYSTTYMELKERYIQALCQELRMRKKYLAEESIETIYLGGGTPSQLAKEDFLRLFDAIDNMYGLEGVKEITLEANPDDLTDDYLQGISSLPINRLSIGIQTFDDGMLKLLNRRHTSEQAVKVVGKARTYGFDNISIDLMYGLPGQTVDSWKSDLEMATSLNVEHISAYHLTYEENTSIYKMLEEQKIEEIEEENSVIFFTMLMDHLKESGYEHYEISNFCKSGMYSRHNTSYWRGVLYMGCGASAHSYNKESRQWNTNNIHKYIDAIESGAPLYEIEYLDENTKYNDLIITSLRTQWGISIPDLKRNFNRKYLDYCLSMAKKHQQTGDLEMNDDNIVLSSKGIFISDAIMRDLLYIAS